MHLGQGTSLFKDRQPEQQLDFVSSVSFDTGFTQLRYRVDQLKAMKEGIAKLDAKGISAIE